jgi:phosphotransferase system HPr (HPr) family protein
MVERTVVVTHSAGLHARPAALFVQSAACFQAHIQVRCGEKLANAKSIVSVLNLGASQGTMLVIQAEGADALAAVQALVALVENTGKEM